MHFIFIQKIKKQKMMNKYQWLQEVYWNNTVQDYLVAVGIIIVGFIVLKILRGVVFRSLVHWSKKTHTTIDDFLVTVIQRSVLPLLYVAVVYVSLRSLTLSSKFQHTLKTIMVVVLTFFAIRIIVSTIEYLLTSYLKRKGSREEKRKEIRGILILLNVVIWAFGLVFLLDNLGFNVATVLTGLGVGGIAVALAAQAVLGDLFAYFVILFDRPFEIGDFLIVDDLMGTVEQVGIKTTRLRSLWGEELVFSNKNLTDSRVHNYKSMETRRIVFGFNVKYGTPAEKLDKIPSVVKKIIEGQANTKFDRVHFAAYKDYGLYFEVVYYVLSPDYNIYMDIQQAINLGIYRKLEEMEIAFALSTQRLLSQPAMAE